MKTVEEVAREVCESIYINNPYPVEIANVAAVIRADREAVLRRVEGAFIDSPSFVGGGKLTVCEKSILADFSESLAAVKKEAQKMTTLEMLRAEI